MICLYLLSFNIDLLFYFFDVIFKHFDYVFERNMNFRCSNFLFNYLLTTKLSSSELQLYFSTRSCRLVGSFFLKILFQLFNLFAKREEFLHILHEHDLCGVHDMFEALENCKVTKMLTLYQTLSQMTLHHQHYNLRLKNILFSLTVKISRCKRALCDQGWFMLYNSGSETVSTKSFHLHLALYNVYFDSLISLLLICILSHTFG